MMKIVVDEPVCPADCPFAIWTDDWKCICGIPAARGSECKCDDENGECPYLVYRK